MQAWSLALRVGQLLVNPHARAGNTGPGQSLKEGARGRGVQKVLVTQRISKESQPEQHETGQQLFTVWRSWRKGMHPLSKLKTEESKDPKLG